MNPLPIENIPPANVLLRVGLALALGLVIGMERERAGKEIGVRTFAFTCLLGALGWMLSSVVGLVSLGLVAMLCILLNAKSVLMKVSLPITTSVCLFITAIIGALVGFGQTYAPTATTLLLVVFLSGKERLVNFSLKLTPKEIQSALTLGIIAFVVYPLLPTDFIDPWRLVDLQNVWLTVILISSISFGNYVLLKVFGTKGITYTGFLGGLVSSTATVTALATNLSSIIARAESGKTTLTFFILRGIRLANSAMFLRNGLVFIAIVPSATPYAIFSLGTMLILSLALALINQGKRNSTEKIEGELPDLGLSSPFSLRITFKYAVLFLLVSVLSELGQRIAGVSGLFLVSIVGGLISSSSVSASVANLLADGKIDPLTAVIAALVASITSLGTHVFIVYRTSGSRSLGVRLAIETSVMVAFGFILVLVQNIVNLPELGITAEKLIPFK